MESEGYDWLATTDLVGQSYNCALNLRGVYKDFWVKINFRG